MSMKIPAVAQAALLCGAFLFGVEAMALPGNGAALPPAEAALDTRMAEEVIEVAPANNILEGAIFDADGNLLFCDVTERKVKMLTGDGRISTLVTLPELCPGGLGIAPDGRLFIAALDLARGKGAVFAWDSGKNVLEMIVPEEAGYWPNDLVFDQKGGFYFSDFRGSSTNPTGGIYYVAPDLIKIESVLTNLAQANGVALSPDGKTLWATEFAKNRLHRMELATPVSSTPIGTSVPYHFIGAAPDSMRVDAEGNVYVAIYGQGRYLIFNDNGIPIGQILLPDRELGMNLLSTSLAVQPNSKHIYMVTSSEKEKGAKIFHSESVGNGQVPPVFDLKK